MAAFLIIKNHSSYPLEKAFSYFEEKGLSSPQQIVVGEYVLYFYKKIAVDVAIHTSENGHQLFVCGTLVYQSRSHQQSIELLLHDLIIGNVDQEKLLGNFCFLHIHQDTIHLYSDALGIQNIYYDHFH